MVKSCLLGITYCTLCNWPDPEAVICLGNCGMIIYAIRFERSTADLKSANTSSVPSLTAPFGSFFIDPHFTNFIPNPFGWKFSSATFFIRLFFFLPDIKTCPERNDSFPLLFHVSKEEMGKNRSSDKKKINTQKKKMSSSERCKK